MINELIQNAKQDRDKSEKQHQRKMEQMELIKTKAAKEACFRVFRKDPKDHW